MGILFLKSGLIVFWLFISYTIIKAFKSFAPWVPIFSKDIERVIEIAGLKAGERFIDLGCGNGKICLAAAKRSSGSVYGIELAWPLYAVCKIRQFLYNEANLHFSFGNLFKASLANFDVIYIYGVPETIKGRLGAKLKSEAKAGARVISYCFEVPGLELAAVSQPSETDLPIYKYVI
jgi:SAM-dependent methyltransferase